MNRVRTNTGEVSRRDQARTGCDSLQGARYQPNRFSRAWLKNGESLSANQRIGYAIMSFVYLLMAVCTGSFSWDSYMSNDPLWLMWALMALFLATFGILGFRNVIRFKRTGRR